MNTIHEINASNIVANIEAQIKDVVRENIDSAYDESKFIEALSELYNIRRSNKKNIIVVDEFVLYVQCLNKRSLKKFIRKRYYGRFYDFLLSFAKTILPKINGKYIVTFDVLQQLDMLYRRNCSLVHLSKPIEQ